LQKAKQRNGWAKLIYGGLCGTARAMRVELCMETHHKPTYKFCTKMSVYFNSYEHGKGSKFQSYI